MSGMSSMLCIPLYRDVPSHHEPNKRGELPLMWSTPPFWMLAVLDASWPMCRSVLVELV